MDMKIVETAVLQVNGVKIDNLYLGWYNSGKNYSTSILPMYILEQGST